MLPVKNGLPAGAALASTTSASSFPDAKLGLTLFTFVRPAIVAPGDVIALAISANKTCHTRNYPSDVYPGGTAVTGTGIAAFPWIDLFGVDEFFETYVVP